MLLFIILDIITIKIDRKLLQVLSTSGIFNFTESLMFPSQNLLSEIDFILSDV